MIERRLDEDTSIIVITADGQWTIADVDAHYDALRLMIDELRREGRPIRVLSDVSRAQRQAHEIEVYILGQMKRTFRPGDRLAILTADTGEKAHARTLVDTVDIWSFCSRLPAEMWLLMNQSGMQVA